MKTRLLSCLVVLLAGFLVVPVAGAATDPCDCWCGETGTGAASIDNKADRDICQDACQDAGQDYIICTNERGAKPPSNIHCWTESECNRYSTETDILNTTAIGGTTWEGNIPKECFAGPAPESYCYPAPIQVDLSIVMGTPDDPVTAVYDLSTYINALYRWLLYAGMIAAGLMIMIGGIEYMLGHGSGQVTKAKDRIRSAIIGIMILFSAYLILATVNPAIVQMSLPRFPLIKQVIWVDDSTTCEALWQQGYILNVDGNQTYSGIGGCTGFLSCPPWFTCGTVAQVVGHVDDKEATIQECVFYGCSEKGSVCTPKRDETYTCMKCEDITPNNEYGVIASTTMCNRFTPEMTYNEADGTGVYKNCFFTMDATVTGAGGGAALEKACALAVIDCNAVKVCQGYDTQTVTYKEDSGESKSTQLDEIQLSSKSGFDPSLFGDMLGDFSLGDACHEDICMVATKYPATFPDGCLTESAAIGGGVVEALTEIITGFQYDCEKAVADMDRGMADFYP